MRVADTRFYWNEDMKGILLAGGSGTRLYPVTRGVSKQLVPVYNKPLVYYPLSTLMLAGIRDVLLITTPEDQSSFQRLLGDGSEVGISLSYATQPRPEGIAQAFLIGADFVGDDGVTLALGDNIFFGHGLQEIFRRAVQRTDGATIFAYQVRDPERYGVVELSDDGRPLDIVEKPEVPRSPWAVTGLYVYDSHVVEIARGLEPSARGELEITDVNRAYLEAGTLHVERLWRGIAWLDTGTHEALHQASSFIHALETRQRLSVACIEEIALRQGWIDQTRLLELADQLGSSSYAEYLRWIAEEGC